MFCLNLGSILENTSFNIPELGWGSSVMVFCSPMRICYKCGPWQVFRPKGLNNQYSQCDCLLIKCIWLAIFFFLCWFDRTWGLLNGATGVFREMFSNNCPRIWVFQFVKHFERFCLNFRSTDKCTTLIIMLGLEFLIFH